MIRFCVYLNESKIVQQYGDLSLMHRVIEDIRINAAGLIVKLDRDSLMKAGPDGFELGLFDLSKRFPKQRRVWTLDIIHIPRSLRGQNVGSQLMTMITSAADEHGVTIGLSPSSDFGSTLIRLKKFYKRFDFQDNRGRYGDSSISASMIRYPGGSRSFPI